MAVRNVTATVASHRSRPVIRMTAQAGRRRPATAGAAVAADVEEVMPVRLAGAAPLHFPRKR
ncbi:hypothetical protein Ade02nite_35090 [Paractinoplanes deccanensis]|uniref:Uncharacterized protein n=1 Tax=Paractinoplanes deccanensis TaxID=113561 RepID=A0ABQ3Y4G4_9ACTN|nr:hypothetical protein Ade02nite_35090 [Actinoplanes deccanensis]